VDLKVDTNIQEEEGFEVFTAVSMKMAVRPDDGGSKDL
jgi:hypothetical protein